MHKRPPALRNRRVGGGLSQPLRVGIAGVLAVSVLLLIAGRYPKAGGGGSSSTDKSLPTVGGVRGAAPDITYPPTKSKATCFQLNPTDSNADVLGENLGTSFYCVVENVCVNDQQFTLFDDALAGREFDFPRQPLLQHPFTVVNKETENAVFLDAQRNGRYYDDDGDGNAGDGAVTAVVKHAYCCGHIGHFMEPIPTLQHALRDLEKNATRRQLAGITSGRIKVTRGGIAKASSLSGGLSSWNEFMLHAAVGGPERPDFKFEKGLLQLNDATTRCFRRSVIAGATYQFFQSPEMAHGFRDAIWARLEHVKRTEAAKPKADPLLAASGAGGFVHDPKKRVILYAQRDAKRAVSDADNMVMILQAAASLVNATVKTIKFGDHPFAVQAAHAQEADVMIGLHGADLTNLVFQRKGAVVIEMNPLFFFESGYREMAAQLEVHYNAWTCTAPTCAFGGVRARWGQVIGNMADLKYNETTRVLTAPNYEPWVWPYKGYVAGCMQCDKSSCCTPLANAFYSALRDDNVRVGEHAAEIAEVLIEGFQSLGWLPADVSARSLAETAVAL